MVSERKENLHYDIFEDNGITFNKGPLVQKLASMIKHRTGTSNFKEESRRESITTSVFCISRKNR